MRLKIKCVAGLLAVSVSTGSHAQTALSANSATENSDATQSADAQPRTLAKLIATDAPLETVLIVAQRDARKSKGATGLDLSLVDTPQSVTVLDRDTLDSFGFDDINDVLRLTTGVNVESVETDRTYYNSRGFDILSMQIDGVGMPLDGLIVGALDTATYDKVEVVRGANGLLTGIGNPSGTVNYVRKRPTNDTTASAELTLGTWNRKRLEADVSTPLVTSGEWAARAVAVVESKDSWLNIYSNERKLFYGVVDGQLGDRATVAFGYTHQDNESDGALWGALPLVYSDGVQGDFDVSTTTAMNWTYWDTHTNTSFAELGVLLPWDWQLKTTLTYTDYNEPSELFYVYLDPGLDPDTGLGAQGNPGKFEINSHSLLSDTSVSGAFNLWGQQHEATLGLSLAKLHSESLDFPASTGFDAMPSFPGWNGNEVSRPEFGSGDLAAKSDVKLNRLYGATRLSVNDAVKLIAGFNAVDYDSEGYSWGIPADASERNFSPYLGATWRIASGINVYASYSDIYQPQYVIAADFKSLGAAKGKSYEAGLKGEWLNKRLLTTLSVFKAQQDNLAEFDTYSDGDGIDDTDASDDFNFAFYKGISVRSQGVEFEVAGKPHESVTLQAGYTHLELKDPNGAETRTFIPRSTLKLLARWQVPTLTGLELGASVRWQDAVYIDTAWGRMNQNAYVILGVQGAYRFNKHFKLSANLDNLTDKKYLNSLYWDQAFYGAPRRINASMSWKY